MKRSLSSSISDYPIYINDDAEIDSANVKKKKKIRPDLAGVTSENTSETVLLDENLLYEVLKHVDARTLATAGCVNKQWHKTSNDERLWELICTKHSANIGCGNNQLRSVVLALGGFKRLHSSYLWPLSKPSSSNGTSSSFSTVVAASSSATASVWPCLPPPRTVVVPAKPVASARWGKDEVQLSLSLLSIRYYEKMNFSNRK